LTKFFKELTQNKKVRRSGNEVKEFDFISRAGGFGSGEPREEAQAELR